MSTAVSAQLKRCRWPQKIRDSEGIGNLSPRQMDYIVGQIEYQWVMRTTVSVRALFFQLIATLYLCLLLAPPDLGSAYLVRSPDQTLRRNHAKMTHLTSCLGYVLASSSRSLTVGTVLNPQSQLILIRLWMVILTRYRMRLERFSRNMKNRMNFGHG
ncbi:hypothetical protein OG21DRAFT_752274 [Imleria badia]|nr:hypothetical protein OG21DRAFT_752274 [Imleria badia]